MTWRMLALAGASALVLGGPALAQQDLNEIVGDALRRAGEAEQQAQAAPTGDAPAGYAPRILPGPPPSAAAPETAPAAAGSATQPAARPAQSPTTAQPPATAAAPADGSAAPASSAGDGATAAASGDMIDRVNAATFQAGAESDEGLSPLILKAQVLLDRANASPGVIDGLYGDNVAKAIAAYETVLGLPIDGRLDQEVWTALGGDSAAPVLVEYTITEDDVDGPFTPEIPSDFAKAAELERMGFTGPAEMLSERFHMDADMLRDLNPGADLSAAGTTIVVADVGDGKPGAKVVRIEADKARRQVRAYDEKGWLVVAYPATIGSKSNPSPSGTHKVSAIAPDPVYYYNPSLNFQQGDNTEKLELPPGPNNPVGTVWIDLSKDGYGIHGTPEPSRIDKTASNGCVRLTNWDAVYLSERIPQGVQVRFVE